MSAALQRARRPFRVRNTLVGLGVAAFAAGAYTYSISAVKQEDFSDIDILAPAVADRAAIKSIEDEQKEKQELKALGAAAVSKAMASGDQRSGILQPAASSTPDFVAPSVLDAATNPSSKTVRGFLSDIVPSAARHPTEGTLVWGAPNVDKVGTMWDRRTLPGDKRQV